MALLFCLLEIVMEGYMPALWSYEPKTTITLIFAGCIDKFLSWRVFIPLSRLTYGVYLIHPIIIFLYYTLVEAVIDMSIFQLVSFSFFLLPCFGDSFKRIKSLNKIREKSQKVLVKTVILRVHYPKLFSWMI